MQMLVIETEKLETGRPLRFDLMSLNGRLLAKAGTRISEEHKSAWIGRGFSKVCSYRESEFTNQPEHLRPYNSEIVQRLEARMEAASEAVLEQSEMILRNQPSNSKQLLRITEDTLADLDLDIAAVLAVALGMESVEVTDHDRAIAQRCTQMSILSMALCTEMGFSEEDRQNAGIAGLLHDVSLMKVTREAVESVSSTLPFKHEFLDHPLASSHLLESILGIHKKICMAVAQVHEQPNGGGFPRGLQAHRIMSIAKVLSTIDAYLTLTSEKQPEPFPVGRNLQPCDAVAYLMHNVGKGRFDTDVVKGLVRAVSLYPIGSRVQLSNDSYATVIRSMGAEPSKPIIRLEDSGFNVIDLRTSSLKITRPVEPENVRKPRISKSELDSLLYR